MTSALRRAATYGTIVLLSLAVVAAAAPSAAAISVQTARYGICNPT
ncbi:hypothetical protein [Streptomyces sp. 891-h]|nr:hypothetical protein [Streptomyces sp. 891-h]UNZ19682.1 hypothetical protein HC362_24220 [Streptomyces sp. 891-h]